MGAVRRFLCALAVLSGVPVVGCGETTHGRDVAEEDAPPRAMRVAGTPVAAKAASGVETVRVVRRAWLRAAPGGEVLERVGPRTRFGGPRVLLVDRRRPGWAGVRSERAGRAGGLAWLPASAVRAERRVDQRLEVDLSARRLVLRRAGRVVLRASVAVGAPQTPTPTARFAVTDRLTMDPGGPYGCCVLALSGRQPRLAPGWPGGDRLALHATSAPSTIGKAASNGCLRATERTMRRLMARVELGTPVVVRA